VDYKKNEVNIFCNKMKELVDAQFRNVERAFTLNSGPYKVSTKYESFAENPSKWVKKSTHLKELYINRIYKLELITTEQPCTSRSSPELDVNEHNPVEEAEPVAVTELSISLKDAGLSEPALVDVWNKAAKIVGDKNSITNAPGLNSSKMVVSYSNPRKPHIVTHYANGKFTCDCQNYLTKNLCAHALATAESLHQLSTFIQWHKEHAQTSLWKLARSSGVPKNPGAKPASRKRSRKVTPTVLTSSSPPLNPPKSTKRPNHTSTDLTVTPSQAQCNVHTLAKSDQTPMSSMPLQPTYHQNNKPTSSISDQMAIPSASFQPTYHQQHYEHLPYFNMYL
jgi:hypothetical protein